MGLQGQSFGNLVSDKMIKRKYKSQIGLLQQTITWYMVAGKLIIIPALGHQNKGKSSFTGSGLFVLTSQYGNNNELARHHVPCDRLLQKAYYHRCGADVLGAGPSSKQLAVNLRSYISFVI